MKTAVIYARYSCDNQTEQSIEGQLRVCNDYAKRNEILILDTYVDRAMSGTNDNRPSFQKMIADSNKKPWDYVIVYKLDRFSRNKYEATIHKKTLKDNGVKVLSAMENIPDSPEGIILEALLEGMNQYFSAELSQKVKRGMKETRLKGFWQGGTLLYGYKLDGRKIIVDEIQAEIVKFIFHQYDNGTYGSEISQNLTEKGIIYRGRSFEDKDIYRILRNEKYTGKYTKDDETIDNLYPKIISQELFDRVQKRIISNRHGRCNKKVKYLLKNKMKCGYCGQNIIGECGTSKTGKRNYYYKCHGRKNLKNGCSKTIERKELIENLIITEIIKEMKNQSIIEKIVKQLLIQQEKLSIMNCALLNLEREKKQIENSLNNLVLAIEKGIISNTTNNRLKELEKRQTEIDKQIITEQDKIAIKVNEEEIRAFFEDGLQLEPLMLLNYFVKEILLFNNEIHIIFNSPLNESPDNSQGFSFCKKIINKSTYVKKGSLLKEMSIQITMII